MTDVQAQPRSVPRRRQQGPPTAKYRGQEAYASENDVASPTSTRNYRVPQTPVKGDNQAIGFEQGTRQRSKAKTRSKPGPCSPESAQRRQGGRQTPPQQPRSVSAKLPTEPAFAGATFHASPAPSSLPMPSFLAKPSGEGQSDTPQGRAGTQKNIAETANHVGSLTPCRPRTSNSRTESPLDFMFRAHREERDQQRRDESPGSFPALGVTPTSKSSQRASRAPYFTSSETPPHTQKPPFGRSRSGFEPGESEGNTAFATGPAFSTPYRERIEAARQHQKPQVNETSEQRLLEDPTLALKKLLFAGKDYGPTQAQDFNQAPHTQAATTVQSSTNVPMADSGDSKPPTIQAMENDLRRILKLQLPDNQDQ